jgi:transposase
MAKITIELDLPDGVQITSTHRIGMAYGFEVTWDWPERCRCDQCGHEADDGLEIIDKVRVVRDLDVMDMPTFWCFKAVAFRCRRCKHRQHIVPPFKRKETAYTYRFEEHVLRMLTFSTEEETAKRLGIAAETVARIVKYQLSQARQVDPTRVITRVGMDEISLKKRHKLYVTILTDLSDPEKPEVLAVAAGRDEKAARTCLECLSKEQREAVQSYNVDMCAAYNAACAELLPKAQGVIDRFHVAKLWNEAIDGERKKNHPGAQEEARQEAAEGVPLAHVGVSPGQEGAETKVPREAGGSLRADSPSTHALRIAAAFQEDLR